MKTKEALAAQVATLERKLAEALAGQAHVYHFADAAIEKAGTKHLMASGVVLTLTVLGGRQIFNPVLIRNGLSDETIEALRGDFRRSYEDATAFKPKSKEVRQ